MTVSEEKEENHLNPLSQKHIIIHSQYFVQFFTVNIIINHLLYTKKANKRLYAAINAPTLLVELTLCRTTTKSARM